MKSKKSIYVLLPLVILIWGAIIYQIFSYSSPESTVTNPQNVLVKPFVIKPKDSIKIVINPRDPFSGKMVDHGAEKAAVKYKNKPSVIQEEVIWPQIRYKGIVSDNKDKIKVYMVIIDGKTYLMKKGETEEEIVLKDGDRDMIYLNYNGDSKVVFIQ